MGSFILGSAQAPITPLPHAFAHNDYWHKRPLFDALDNGFTHIEADIYLRHSKLVVAHGPVMIKRNRTIEDLYLRPLMQRLSDSNIQVQTPMDTVVLLIDIKSKGGRTLNALTKILQKYKSVLSTCEQGKIFKRNLTLVLSGHCPWKMFKKDEYRYVFADANLRKIKHSEDQSSLFQMASCKYSRIMKWKGRGEVPEEEKQKLQALVDKAHQSGAKVRLWASPENENVWTLLRNCGVDLINTDKLTDLKRFFTKNEADQETLITEEL